ncbi:helix-turn-helix transcriptional regulator [Pseudomonas monteilii]|uniref:helix-turn-helix transcriptional regulator n=1 Tax=Pseudomonas monteilii TaxID=76759 RepID=UPI001CC0F28E|nr:AlpA family phage regulatory protein [Pseudomonas monteilii]
MKSTREIGVMNLDPTETFQQQVFRSGRLNKEDKNTAQNPLPERIKSHKDPNLTAQIIRLNELTKMLSISRSCIYDWMNPRSPRHDPSFPKQIHLTGRTSGGAVGWRLESIVAWIESRS